MLQPSMWLVSFEMGKDAFPKINFFEVDLAYDYDHEPPKGIYVAYDTLQNQNILFQ